ncbi:MAG: TetR/AcrR family transcriptional regulator [Pseudorhodoferax sp.]
MGSTSEGKAPPLPDHRVEVAARRREKMRARLLEATLAVFSRPSRTAPDIGDVVDCAKVSRGTFYLYFQTLDEALQTLVQQQSDEMTRACLPFYDMLKEPCQRFAVGCRLFLMRASMDPQWASFMTRAMPLDNKQLLAGYMHEDLEQGRALGQFRYVDGHAALDIELSTLIAGIGSLGKGVPDPESYMDECIRIALTGLGCAPDLCERSLHFSRKHLQGWTWVRTGTPGPRFAQ